MYNEFMIGRKKEQEEFNNIYNSNRAQLVAVYGRRRVGKTYLVDETFKGKIAFRHAGLSTNRSRERNFYKSIEGTTETFLQFPIASWNEER